MLLALKAITVSLLSLSIPLAVNATGHARSNRHASVAKRSNRHASVAKRSNSSNSTLSKRFSGARWTFYDVSVGLGACGKQNEPSDFTVALNSAQYGGGFPGPHCFEKITMTYNGKTTTATIMDECPGCPYGGLDLTEGLFSFFASEDEGVIYGEWSFADGSGGGDPAPSPSPSPPPPPPKPTTSKHTPTSTFVPPPPTTTSTTETPTTTKQHKTTSSTVSSSSATPSTEQSSSQISTSSTASASSSAAHSSSAASSAVAPSATPSTVTTTTGNLLNLNQYLVGLVSVVTVGSSSSS